MLSYILQINNANYLVSIEVSFTSAQKRITITPGNVKKATIKENLEKLNVYSDLFLRTQKHWVWFKSYSAVSFLYFYYVYQQFVNTVAVFL